jgi:PAS domain S-box-containing protein
MLSSVKKFRPARNEFIYPYLIRTDSKGFIIAASDQLIALLSDHNITDYLYKNISDIFSVMGHLQPVLKVQFEQTGLPGIIDLFLDLPEKSSVFTRWICTPISAENKQPAGWQLTGVEIPVSQKNIPPLPGTLNKNGYDDNIPVKAAIENASDAICITGIDFRVIYQNPSHAEIFKRSIRDWNREKGILACFKEPRITEQLTSEVKQGRPWAGDIRAANKTGLVIDLSLRADSIKNIQGEVIGFILSFTDIRERKAAALHLQLYSEQITNILDSITDGFFMLDKTFRVTLWNQEAEKIMGLAANKIVGKNILEKLPELVDLKIYKAFLKAFRKKTTFASEHYIARLGLWLEMNAYPSAQGLFVYFKDVTKRKKQEMLLELEKKVLEINSDQKASLRVTIDYFLEGIERIFPGMLCSVLSLDDDRISLRHLSAPSLPVEFSSFIDGLKIGPATGSCGTAVYLKKRIIVKDIATDPLWENFKELALPFNLRACWSLPILGLHGNVLAVFAMYYRYSKSPTEMELNILDRAANLIKIIIENKRAEEKIKMINERYILATKATNDVIWDWDLGSAVPFWSESFYIQFGFKAGKKVSVPGFWESHVHPDDRVRVVENMNKFIAEKKTGLWLDEYRFKKANGKFVLISDRGFLIYDKEGKPVRMVGSMQDITDKREMEKKLLKQELNKQKLIVQAVVNAQEKERAEIGKELHDNVNQILSTTKLYLELARTDDAERMNLVARSAKNLHHAINEIRNISRSLVPPSIGDLGLVDSINDLIENIKAIKAIHVEFYPVGSFE